MVQLKQNIRASHQNPDQQERLSPKKIISAIPKPGVRVPGSRLSSHPQLTSDVSISPAALPEEPLPSIAVERRQRPPCGSLLPQPLLSKKPGLQGLWKTLFTERGRENCFSRSYQSQVFIGLSLNHGITKEARACTGERTIFLEAGQAAST